MSNIKLQNNGGNHMLGNRVIKKGDVFEGPESLITKFPGKFAHAAGNLTVTAPETPQAAAEAPEKENAAADVKPEADDRNDQTDQFNQGDGSFLLKVYKENNKWNVYEDEDEEPLNDTPLAKNKVQAFIDEYIAD